MSEFKWFTKFRYGKSLPHDVEHGALTVKEDGSLHVDVDDDYYSGEMNIHDARRMAEEIWAPMQAAEYAGYAAYAADPSDTREAKERDLYPDDQNMRIQWGSGWLRAQIDDELGIDVKEYAPIGGAGLGRIQEEIRKLKYEAFEAPAEHVSDIKRLRLWLKDFLDDDEDKKRSYDAPLELLVKGIINKLLKKQGAGR